MYRTLILRVVAILLLAITTSEVYACDIAAACVQVGSGGTIDDCDQPAGDNCLCCCQHVVPQSLIVALQPGAVIDQIAPLPPVQRTLSRPSYIDHPPQL